MNFKKLLILFLLLPLCIESKAFKHDYSQTWVTQMFLAIPDSTGEAHVFMTYEQALEAIKISDNLSLGVPKIVYLIGWQYKGHDDKYPAHFEANEALKRPCDKTALESLRWLIREARKYNTTVSLHINMTDAYMDSPIWDEYVKKDLISKNADGSLKKLGIWNHRQAYQVNYKNEWNAGYTQWRIDTLFKMIPELKEAGTIHLDAWFARPSEGHNESMYEEREYQKKSILYWEKKGVDVTSEWVIDYLIGYVPYAWHFTRFRQREYLNIPARVYTGTHINEAVKSSDHDLGFLFGTSSYATPSWQLGPDYTYWEKPITKDFMLNVPQYCFLNKLQRDSVTGKGKERISWFSDKVSVSLSDSIVRQDGRILREKSTLCIPAVWRKDNGVIIYSDNRSGEMEFDTPVQWDGTKKATLYKVTVSGLQKIGPIKIRNNRMTIDIKQETAYYAIPE